METGSSGPTSHQSSRPTVQGHGGGDRLGSKWRLGAITCSLMTPFGTTSWEGIKARSSFRHRRHSLLKEIFHSKREHRPSLTLFQEQEKRRPVRTADLRHGRKASQHQSVHGMIKTREKCVQLHLTCMFLNFGRQPDTLHRERTLSFDGKFIPSIFTSRTH